MMKRLLLSVGVVLSGLGVFAQTVETALKDMFDGRVQKARKDLEAVVAGKPNDAEANYWLGQAMLAAAKPNGQAAQVAAREKVKELYTKAMAATSQSPLLMVGVGHIELLEGKNAEAKAHFDAAIAATANKKNKKYGEPAILNAIVRANADGSSKIGDLALTEEKAKQSEEILGATPDMFVNLGIMYLKTGGENGGPAKRSFEKALALDANYAPALYRIGLIFESQRNTEMFMDYYQKSVQANSKFAPGYLELYEHWSMKDVNKAQEYLEAYVANSDKDRETDYFKGDYLFRAGKYTESLKMAEEIEAGLNGERFPKVNKLYAFNYDRLGGKLLPNGVSIGMGKSQVTQLLKDPKSVSKTSIPAGTSEMWFYDGYAIGFDTNGLVDYVLESKGTVEPNAPNSKEYFTKAMQYLEKYMAETEDDNKSADDYALMAAQYLKVPGNLEKAELNAEKAVSMDTSLVGKVAIMDKLIAAYGAQQNWAGQFKWMKRRNELKPDNSARNLFFMVDAAHKAKLYDDAVAMASQYITTFPDQVQGYSLKVRSAMAADPDTSKGSAIEALDQYSAFMMSDTAKYRKRIINNHGYKIYYYIVKAQDFTKALASANDILALEPTNEYALGAKAEAERFIKATGGKAAAAGGAKPAAASGNVPKTPEPRK